MILVDSRVGSQELHPIIKKIGVPCEKAHLEYGDACFDGYGPKGPMTVGIERKALHDMLACIDDARYAGHQLPGMARLYGKSVLMLEGEWRAHDPTGLLMECHNGQWHQCRYRSQPVMYSKLYRYLLSINFAGVIITYSRDLFQTAYNICEMYHYFQKKWNQHTSMSEIHQPPIASLAPHPSLVRKWAAQIEGVGTVLSGDAERLFKTPIQLAKADELDWMEIPRVGAATAKRIVKEINGWR